MQTMVKAKSGEGLKNNVGDPGGGASRFVFSNPSGCFHRAANRCLPDGITFIIIHEIQEGIHNCNQPSRLHPWLGSQCNIDRQRCHLR